MKLNFLPFALVLSLASVFPAFASFSSYGIPDSADVRAELQASWLEAPLAAVRTKDAEVYDDHAGHSFKVWGEDAGSFFKLVVAPKSSMQMDYIKGGETRRLETVAYKEGTAGTWVLYRDAKSGKPSKIRIYFNADSDVYLELRNGENKTFADMVLYNCYMVRSVPLGVRFKKLYSMPFDALQSLTKKSLPWASVNVVPGQYHPVLQMVAVIRSYLPRIVYAQDAAYNEEGKLYSVQLNEPFDLSEEAIRRDPSLEAARHAVDAGSGLVLSAPGFIKWVADGIVEPATGSCTNLGKMVAPTVNYSSLGKKGVIAQSWNLSLTLDCCRNLAVDALNSRLTKRSYTYKMGARDETGVDVTVEPFVSDIVEDGELRSAGYIKDTGYSMTELKSLLYILAVTESQYIYFGAIKSYSQETASASVFNNCAVFLPYFDDNGRFDCIVFEQGKEYTLDAFIDLHGMSYVHLERVKSTDYFHPLYK